MNATTTEQNSGLTSTTNGQKSTISAIRLNAGEVLYLGQPRVPESKMLVQGQHFDFTPPYKGRPGNEWAVMDARFTAKVPLLLAARDLDGQWARSIGHFRVARPGKSEFGICSPEQIVDEFPLRKGAKDAGYPEYLILGGPAAAVLYRDEIVIPAYRGHGERVLPFGFIVEQKDREMLTNVFRAGNRDERQARQGQAVAPRGVIASGIIQTRVLGPSTLKFDRVGRIHGIEQHFEETGEIMVKTWTRFQNGIECRIGEMVTDNRLRAALDLELLPVVPGTTVQEHRPVRQHRPLVQKEITVGAATPTAALLDQVKVVPAPPKVVPTAVRRTAAPKLADVTTPEPEAAPESEAVAASPEVEAPVGRPPVSFLAAVGMLAVRPAEPEVTEAEPEATPTPEEETPEEVVSEPEVEVTSPEVAPTLPESAPTHSATAELLVEEFGKEQLPLLVAEDGQTVLALPGATMDLEMASRLEAHFEAGGALWLNPTLVGWLARFNSVYELEHPTPPGFQAK